MKTIFINLILSLLKRLSSPALVERTKELVLLMMDMDVPGEEKREAVVQMLREGYDAAAEAAAETAPHLVNLVIEAAVAWAKQRQRRG